MGSACLIYYYLKTITVIRHGVLLFTFSIFLRILLPFFGRHRSRDPGLHLLILSFLSCPLPLLFLLRVDGVALQSVEQTEDNNYIPTRC